MSERAEYIGAQIIKVDTSSKKPWDPNSAIKVDKGNTEVAKIDGGSLLVLQQSNHIALIGNVPSSYELTIHDEEGARKSDFEGYIYVTRPNVQYEFSPGEGQKGEVTIINTRLLSQLDQDWTKNK